MHPRIAPIAATHRPLGPQIKYHSREFGPPNFRFGFPSATSSGKTSQSSWFVCNVAGLYRITQTQAKARCSVISCHHLKHPPHCAPGPSLTKSEQFNLSQMGAIFTNIIILQCFRSEQSLYIYLNH